MPIRPHDPGFFDVGLISTGDGDDDFGVLLQINGVGCQDEGPFIADIFYGALVLVSVDGKRYLPAADCSSNSSFVIHVRIINAVAKNLNKENSLCGS